MSRLEIECIVIAKAANNDTIHAAAGPGLQMEFDASHKAVHIIAHGWDNKQSTFLDVVDALESMQLSLLEGTGAQAGRGNDQS
jgi:hypothetical protein